jgi:SAM-dependent methyltransferase
MSAADVPAGAAQTGDRLTPALFALAIFTSASLVFVVQPMVTKLVLPMLGGSPQVWNTAMVFFQAALLAGYGYAHLLQRIGSLRTQVIVHLALLLVAALFLPLGVSGALGNPDPAAPILWLLGTLTLSIGAPFAVLSATAPLLQAWYARVRVGHADCKNPYVLYAASNLGSFLALLSYPVLIEPLATLSGQRWGWTGGYAVFVALIVVMALTVWRRQAAAAEPAPLERSAPLSWKDRLILIGLAAAPSSLMLGVTAHLSTDVASAPFLWVIPLALYLLTFVIAFQSRPWIPLPVTLVVQAAVGAVAVTLAAFRSDEWLVLFGISILAFFFTTLMCHQLLAARRPAPDRLTEFYLLMSLGGVVGGAFTALLAPVIFNDVWEYPLMLVLVGFARPWGRGWKLDYRDAYFLLAGVVIAALPPVIHMVVHANEMLWPLFQSPAIFRQITVLLLGAAAVCAFLIRDRALAYVALLTAMTLSAQWINKGADSAYTERSFFGVMQVANQPDERLGGDVHALMHGTTLHGAQARDPRYACSPMTYYAPTTPIGQAAVMVQNRGPAVNIGVVGQGSGAMAAYKRAGDTLTFFEIDPMVDRLSRDPRWFTYISDCAQGPVRTVLGDARLTLEEEPAGSYDLLIIDAFSSDAVPTHLLTQEAIDGYLQLLKPDGVVLLHLSNRNLDITLPALAAARALGVPERHQIYIEDRNAPDMAEASTEAMILSPTEAGMADFAADPRWRVLAPTEVRPWTDDYVNLFGSLVRATF